MIPRQFVSLAVAALAFCGCGDDETSTPAGTSLLDPPAEGRGVQLRMQTVIDPGLEVEQCQFFRAPAEGLNIQRDEVRFTEGSHHVLVYLTPYMELPTEDELGGPIDASRPFDCSDGPTARWRVSTLVGGSQNATGDSIVEFPEDVAMKVAGGSILMVNAHYINTSSSPIEPEIRVNLHSIPDAQMRAEGGLLFWYDPFIRVGAHSTSRASMSCPLSSDIELSNAQSHMHRRGVGYVAEHVAPDGTRSTLYENTSWADVPVKRWPDALAIPAGSRIEYACSYQNDEDRIVWQGPRSTDEMCMFVASYWPVRPDTSLCASDPEDALGTQSLAADWIGDGEAGCAQTLGCVQTASGSTDGDEVFRGITECVLAARPASSVLVSDVVRCLFTSVDPAADCQAEIQACQAE
jgi:hypothetical protein